MSHPFILTLKTIKCSYTDDSYGSDDLVGKMGADRFRIGKFNDGDIKDVDIQRPIAPEVNELQIIEEDTLSSDDLLITIDLTQEMDQERTVKVESGRARYDITFEVTSDRG